MKLFYGEIFPKAQIHIDEQAHIVKTLRMKTGDNIAITDGKGNLAKGRLLIEGKKANIEIDKIESENPQFKPYLHIAIAPTKNIDRIEFFIEKATEMGISEITFLHTEKSERKLINIEKIQKQVISASKQSLRYHFPKINSLVRISDFIDTIDVSSCFVAHCDLNFERSSLHNIENLDYYTFLIGPEGDFSPKEINMLIDKNIKAITLGNQRLRTESAGVLIASWNYLKTFS